MGLMRKALLWASTDPFLARRLPRMGFVRRAARRFMPGEEPEDALRESARLNREGAGTILTLLGENVGDDSEASAVADHYVTLLDRIEERELDTEVSIKPTQLGLDLGPEVARRNLTRIVERSARSGRMVWVDMESSPYVDRTLALFRAVRETHDNVGLCLQSYLRRTDDDLEALLPLRPAIRLVKGAYMEPPEVAYPDKREVDAAFLRLTGRLLHAASEGRVGRVAIGTHDPRMIGEARTRAHELTLAPEAWEVEMLFGIGLSDQDRLLRGDTRLRVLISYGSHWFPWYMRRLAERPANVWFVVRKMVGG